MMGEVVIYAFTTVARRPSATAACQSASQNLVDHSVYCPGDRKAGHRTKVAFSSYQPTGRPQSARYR